MFFLRELWYFAFDFIVILIRIRSLCNVKYATNKIYRYFPKEKYALISKCHNFRRNGSTTCARLPAAGKTLTGGLSIASR